MFSESLNSRPKNKRSSFHINNFSQAKESFFKASAHNPEVQKNAFDYFIKAYSDTSYELVKEEFYISACAKLDSVIQNQLGMLQQYLNEYDWQYIYRQLTHEETKHHFILEELQIAFNYRSEQAKFRDRPHQKTAFSKLSNHQLLQYLMTNPDDSLDFNHLSSRKKTVVKEALREIIAAEESKLLIKQALDICFY